MRIKQLVIEITRRCNAACDHCMRGNKEPCDISDGTLELILQDVTEIDMITFTGGEPSLNPDAIDNFIDMLIDRNIIVHGFYVITNGKEGSFTLALALLRLYAWSSKEDCHLLISEDGFHSGINSDKAKKLYSAFSFFGTFKTDYDTLVQEGKITGPKGRPAFLEPMMITETANGEPYIEGTVYVNVHGKVIPSCEFSYETQEKNEIGDVHTNTILEIITQYLGG